MARTANRKTQQKAAKKSDESSEEQSTPAVTRSSVKQYKNKNNTKLSKKILKKKESDANIVSQEVDDSDDEISFNFKARNKEEVSKCTKTDSVELKNTTSVLNQETFATGTFGTLAKNQVQMLSETRKSVKENQKAHEASDKVPMGSISNKEPDDVGMDTNQVHVAKTILKKQSHASSREGKKQSDVKPKPRKLKPCKVGEHEDIFFYCGNLPPGVTRETLKYFLEEEGIHPRVSIKKKGMKTAPTATLTAKQKLYKKNRLKAAKSLFATVIVKTEEEAMKMMFLNGITMPSPSNKAWDTELKIVRRLPRPKKCPYKVHIGGLHPGTDEEELKQYLESRGVTPGHVVIIRTQRTQKPKRYGFLWFGSIPEADKAVDLPEPVMRDHPLVLQHSFKRRFKNF